MTFPSTLVAKVSTKMTFFLTDFIALTAWWVSCELLCNISLQLRNLNYKIWQFLFLWYFLLLGASTLGYNGVGIDDLHRINDWLIIMFFSWPYSKPFILALLLKKLFHIFQLFLLKQLHKSSVGLFACFLLT